MSVAVNYVFGVERAPGTGWRNTTDEQSRASGTSAETGEDPS